MAGLALNGETLALMPVTSRALARAPPAATGPAADLPAISRHYMQSEHEPHVDDENESPEEDGHNFKECSLELGPLANGQYISALRGGADAEVGPETGLQQGQGIYHATLTRLAAPWMN